METIASRDNRVIKNVCKLMESSKERREQGLFVAEGIRLCEDAANSRAEIVLTLSTRSAREKYPEQAEKVLAASAKNYDMTEELSAKISDTKSPQGIISVCRTLDKNANLVHIIKDSLFLVLEDLQDPANMGAVFRSAEAFGMSGVILAGNCCDIYAPKTVRAGMGAVFRLPILRTASGTEAAELLEKSGVRTFAAVVHAEAKPVGECGLGKGCAVFIGNEGNGLKPETVDACGTKVTIPMRGRAESLNAAAAAAVLMWEMIR